MKKKCRSNNCMRVGVFENGICPRCIKLIKTNKIGFRSTKRKTISKESKSSYSKALKRAKTAIQLLRRVEDADDKGFVKCVHGSYRKWNKCDGGHYISAKWLYTCFRKENINPQEKHKNMDMDNPVTSQEYTEYMIKRYGIKLVTELQQSHKMSVKYTAWELNEMAERWEQESNKIIKIKGLKI